jgi:hypothetical protein
LFGYKQQPNEARITQLFALAQPAWSYKTSFENEISDLPDGLTEISYSAFYGCKNLKYIVINTSDTTAFKCVAALVPKAFKNKIIPLEKYQKILSIREEAIDQLSHQPKVTTLADIKRAVLTDDMLAMVSVYGDTEQTTRPLFTEEYYKTKNCIQETLPSKTDDDLSLYKVACSALVTSS